VRFRLRARGLALDAAEQSRIAQHVRLALGRHAARIASVEVRLAPSPRMQGAGRTSCRIRVRQRDGHSLLAEDHAERAFEAAVSASARLEGRLERQRSLLRPLSFQHRVARGGGLS
jgi:ribosome-associated translation inhibitor RaiA